jgi:hypothetical protein
MTPTEPTQPSWPEWRWDWWHAAYRRWHDHRGAGHRIRAAVWGWLTDRIAG